MNAACFLKHRRCYNTRFKQVQFQVQFASAVSSQSIKMKFTKVEMFAIKQWRKNHTGVITRSKAVNYITKLRNLIKRKCCEKKLNRDYSTYTLKNYCVEFSTRDRCMLSFTTNIMKALVYKGTSYTTTGMINRGIVNHKNEYQIKMLQSFDEFDPECPWKKSDAEFALKNSDSLIRQCLTFKFDHSSFNYADTRFYNMEREENGACYCESDEAFRNYYLTRLNKNSTVMEPMMCADFLHQYMIPNEKLEEMDLAKKLKYYLLPFVAILPRFGSMSHILISKYEECLSYNRMHGKYIPMDLNFEFRSIDRNFDRNEVYESEVPSFIVSGTFVLFLLGQIDTFNEIDFF